MSQRPVLSPLSSSLHRSLSLNSLPLHRTAPFPKTTPRFYNPLHAVIRPAVCATSGSQMSLNGSPSLLSHCWLWPDPFSFELRTSLSFISPLITPRCYGAFTPLHRPGLSAPPLPSELGPMLSSSARPGGSAGPTLRNFFFPQQQPFHRSKPPHAPEHSRYIHPAFLDSHQAAG